uniref:Fibrinogen C-terminal domain-containing protein n=1 Tax=Amphimedon queenslandica TaxID=400682 RepID=A0A1X7SRF0_AMPQE
MKFSTKDRDNDIHPDPAYSCAAYHQSGWWYHGCYNSNLNAPYYNNPTCPDWHGIIWYLWKGKKYSLKFTEMKVRHN